MRIDKTQPSPSASHTQAAHSGTRSSQPDKPVAPVRPSDRVRISDAGRALAQGIETGLDAADTELTPERIEEIRSRIEAGAYDAPEMVESVVRAILDSGDLRLPRSE